MSGEYLDLWLTKLKSIRAELAEIAMIQLKNKRSFEY